MVTVRYFEEETFDCVMELHVDENIQKRVMNASRILVEREFKRLVMLAVSDPRPVKVYLAVTVPYYNQFDKEWVNRENSVTFANILYTQKYGDL